MVCRDGDGDRKSTRLNSSHQIISYAVFCLKKNSIQTLPCAFFYLFGNLNFPLSAKEAYKPHLPEIRLNRVPGFSDGRHDFYNGSPPDILPFSLPPFPSQL